MRIASWNVNSVRQRLAPLLAKARRHLREVRIVNARLRHGDGLRGVPIPRLEIPGLTSLAIGDTTLLPMKIDPMVNPYGFYYLALALLFLSMLALQRIVNSPYGRALQAIRESEERAVAERRVEPGTKGKERHRWSIVAPKPI